MIPYQNYTVFTSVLFYLLSKFLSYFLVYCQMHGKHHLSSIPENNENEEIERSKWVPKKKHETLKAKYKCLKKLFQIYDASMIGMLPDTYKAEEFAPEDQRRKRSNRTKTDASGCADTVEASSGDVTELDGDSTTGTAALEDLNTNQSRSTQIMTEKTESTKFKDSNTQDSKVTLNICHNECEGTQTAQTVENFRPNMEFEIPHLRFNEKRKLTRFQTFMSRIFGLKTQEDHVYALSDNNITHHCRRRGLRFRRVRRSRKIRSEGVLSLRSPVILSFMQSVQRNCLMDTTRRQCPIVGCKMITSGIINYNDHLNLCHFTNRIYICHYCHEGFENQNDKCFHENEHIGLTKLNVSATSSRQSAKKGSITQTEPQLGIQEEKLRKIVSFFDRMVNEDRVLAEIKNNRYSESNLRTIQRSSKLESNETTSNSIGDSSSCADKRTVSCGHLPRRACERDGTSSELTGDGCSSVKCQLCGEQFDYRRQLSLHVDLEHRMHNKYSKFHSCAGIMNSNPKKTCVSPSDDENTLCRVNTCSTLTQGFKVTNEGYNIRKDDYKVPNEDYKIPKGSYKVERRNSAGSLSCDTSTNIIYYESLEAVRKPSVIDNIVKRVRSGISSYKWEPGTKIIRV